MANLQKNPDAHSPGLYVIRVREQIPAHRREWFEGMTIVRTADGETVLCGELADQSALHGLLNKIRDMNLTLVSVQRL